MSLPHPSDTLRRSRVRFPVSTSPPLSTSKRAKEMFSIRDDTRNWRTCVFCWLFVWLPNIHDCVGANKKDLENNNILEGRLFKRRDSTQFSGERCIVLHNRRKTRHYVNAKKALLYETTTKNKNEWKPSRREMSLERFKNEKKVWKSCLRSCQREIRLPDGHHGRCCPWWDLPKGSVLRHLYEGGHIQWQVDGQWSFCLIDIILDNGLHLRFQIFL